MNETGLGVNLQQRELCTVASFKDRDDSDCELICAENGEGNLQFVCGPLRRVFDRGQAKDLGNWIGIWGYGGKLRKPMPLMFPMLENHKCPVCESRYMGATIPSLKPPMCESCAYKELARLQGENVDLKKSAAALESNLVSIATEAGVNAWTEPEDFERIMDVVRAGRVLDSTEMCGLGHQIVNAVGKMLRKESDIQPAEAPKASK